MRRFSFPATPVSVEETALRAEVRDFLRKERAAGSFAVSPDCWVSAASPEFSAKVGTKGWIGLTWPRHYGGHERPALHRWVVTEEMLAAGAPVSAHWIADRQTGPQILKFGTEAQKRDILPRIAAGRCFTAIGMSEPQAGSDLAAVQARAERTADGWRLKGRKIWSTMAHIADYMIVLARTSPPDGRNRQVGLSQFLVDLKLPGISISAIRDIVGSAHFNETQFDDVDLSHDALLGTEGQGWSQVMGELALERSGPERFLTTLVVLETALPTIAPYLDRHGLATLGRLLAHLAALRRMSRGIARLLQEKQPADVVAALTKLLGNAFERDVLEGVREMLAAVPAAEVPASLSSLISEAQMRLPSFTLRGGTTEILRGIVARQLGMR